MEGLDIPAPEHEIKETESDVTLAIRAPLCKSNELSVFLDKKTVTFESHPYFLRVKLPCRVSNEAIEEHFDEGTGMYSLRFKKKICNGKDESDSDNAENDNALFDHCNNIHQGADVTKSCNTDNEKSHYGFLNLYSGLFGQYYREFSQVIDLPDPDYTHVEERKGLREQVEDEKWSDEHYLADFMEPEQLRPLFDYVPPWISNESGSLTEEEKDVLESLPRCEWLEWNLDDEKKAFAERQMIDVLLAYCYNKRSTEGENTVESSWTISKLSSTLSWFEVFPDLRSVVLSFYRRSLTYPLYRNWELAKRIHGDAADLLKSGPETIARCFIEIKELFDDSEYCHVLNTLYINHLCRFALLLTRERSGELAKELETVEVTKPEMERDLVFLEIAAKEALREENDGEEEDEGAAKRILDDIVEQVAALNITRRRAASSPSITESDYDSSAATCSSDSSAICSSSSSSSSSYESE